MARQCGVQELLKCQEGRMRNSRGLEGGKDQTWETAQFVECLPLKYED